MGCMGGHYPVQYNFNFTEHNGFMNGFIPPPVPTWWSALGFNSEYPNTVVDFEYIEGSDQYDWVIEFQCDQGKNALGKPHVKFTGFNFYSA